MKTKVLKTALISIITFLIAGNLFAQDINLGDFNEISIQDNLDVILTQGTTNSYRTEPKEVSVDISNTGNKLSIKRGTDKKSVTVYINFTQLNAIAVLGSATVGTSKPMQANNLKLNLTGSGDLRVNVVAANVEASVAGSGDIYVEGTTTNLQGAVAGSGDLMAANLKAENVKIEVAGSGDAAVNVTNTLDASVAGSGDVRYVGNPATRNVNIVGSGSISETSQEKANAKDISINSEIKIKTDGGSASSNDTTRLSFGDRKIIIIDDEDDDKEKADKKVKKENEIKHIWAGVELGFSGYSNKMFNTTLPNGGAYALDYLRSNVVNINPFERNISLYKNYVAITTGLGFQFNRYMFENNTILFPLKDSIQTVNTGIGYTKNMVKSSFLTLPLLLQFNTSKNHGKSFHFAVGGQVAVKLGSRSKQVYNVEGDKKRDVFKSAYNLNPFQYGLTARVGYGKVNVFANYNLSEVFKNGKGPELYPFQIGLTLIPW
ncbi:MAG TPA: DUF2807 domain-containing protein [Bacteroidia bacterium]|nr:DUF2807 domain-containing protein [Bacteroidia bacterium]